MVFILRWLMFFVGNFFFSIGICLAINVQYLGIQTWDVLNVALYESYGLSIGVWSILIGLVLVVLALIFDKRYIKIGTFMNIFIVGFYVDLFLWLDFLPKASQSWTDILIIISGIVIMGLAGGMYNAGEVGAGPRDGFMLAIAARWGFPIRRVRMITETGVVILGLLLGGPVFLFTFAFTFIQSPLFQFSFLRLNQLIQRVELRQKENNLLSTMSK